VENQLGCHSQSVTSFVAIGTVICEVAFIIVILWNFLWLHSVFYRGLYPHHRCLEWCIFTSSWLIYYCTF